MTPEKSASMGTFKENSSISQKSQHRTVEQALWLTALGSTSRGTGRLFSVMLDHSSSRKMYNQSQVFIADGSHMLRFLTQKCLLCILIAFSYRMESWPFDFQDVIHGIIPLWQPNCSESRPHANEQTAVWMNKQDCVTKAAFMGDPPSWNIPPNDHSSGDTCCCTSHANECLSIWSYSD